MSDSDLRLLAWVVPATPFYVGTWVSSDWPTRCPARLCCETPDEAKRWIELEAQLLGVPVEWVEPGRLASDARRWAEDMLR